MSLWCHIHWRSGADTIWYTFSWNIRYRYIFAWLHNSRKSALQTLACPTDFLAPYSLAYTDAGNDANFLDFKDANYVQQFNPDPTTEGAPRYYAVFDLTNFIIGPTPNSSYAVELHYFYRPVSLTVGSGTGTTWLSENAELAMLYGSLMEAYIFMKGEPDMQALYEKRFGESIMGLKMFGEAEEVTDQYRTGQIIRPKQW